MIQFLPYSCHHHVRFIDFMSPIVSIAMKTFTLDRCRWQVESWRGGSGVRRMFLELACILDALQLLYLRCAMQLRWVGWGVFTFALYSMVESNISTMFGCVCLGSREYWLIDLTLAERKRCIGYPYRSCRTSVPLFMGSGFYISNENNKCRSFPPALPLHT